MANIVVAKPRTIKVSSNATAGIINTSVPVTLKNNTTLLSGNGASTVEQLLDVNVVSKITGATLVYDSTTNTYLIEPLNFADITGSIDSGTF